MKQISTKEIVDLFAYNKDSAVLVEKRPLPGNAQYKVNYSVVNFATGEQEVITKSAYLLRKFGSAFQKISTEIPNFVQCDAAVLYDRRVLVIYPNGEAGIFDREGTLEWNGMFQYHDAPVKHLALEEKYFWSVCPGENAVIRYACQNMKVDLRIGGKDAQTFVNPQHICQYNGDLYVACGGNKIRKIDGMDYTVSDYRTFSQQVKRYHKFGQYALWCWKAAPTWWTKPKNDPYIKTRHTPAGVCLVFMPLGRKKAAGNACGYLI